MRYILVILVLWCIDTCLAQKTRCATNAYRQYYNLDALDTWLPEDNTTTRTSTPDAIWTIPVVVHVVYNTTNLIENISDAQVMSQIAILNKDFSRQNTDTTNIPSYFRSVSADTEIQFCLASVDPNGNPTTGINRVATTTNQVGSFSTQSVKVEARAWNVNQYMNIWVCEIDNNGNTLGYATLAKDAPVLGSSDGVVIDYRYFGDIGTGTTFPAFTKGRTTTHEVGHYFNLNHIWGDDENNANNCNGTDNVADTPNQSDFTSGCPSGVVTDACSPNANGRMYQNYLDYTDDNCMCMFTLGQKTRMRQAIFTFRNGLINSNKCVATGIKDRQIATINLFPNPTNHILNIKISAPTTDNVTLQIIDISGKIWNSTEVNFQYFNNTIVDISNLPAGIYAIKYTQNEYVASGSFVKID